MLPLPDTPGVILVVGLDPVALAHEVHYLEAVVGPWQTEPDLIELGVANRRPVEWRFAVYVPWSTVCRSGLHGLTASLERFPNIEVVRLVARTSKPLPADAVEYLRELQGRT